MYITQVLRSLRAMSDSTLPKSWPTLPVSMAGIVLTLCAVFLLLDVRIDADVYSLLGDDDPSVQLFEGLSSTTPGLEELLVICKPGELLTRPQLGDITAIDGVVANTRSYLGGGKSPLYGFSLSVDASDWLQTKPIILEAEAVLAAANPSCGMTGTPAIVYEMQERVDTDLRVAVVTAVILVSLIFAFVYRIGLLALFMMIPVGLGIVWGLAAYSLIRTDLTLLAATVPTLLFGIGIDHSIHMIQSCRYAMKDDGMPRRDAVLSAWKRKLRPITLASLTTAIAFTSLTRANLSGFVDLGWSGALVTLGVYAACVSLLPIVLLYCPEKWLQHRAAFERPVRQLAPFIERHGIKLSLLTVVVTVIASFSAYDLKMLGDNHKLETRGLVSRDLQDRIAEEHQLSTSPLLLIFESAEDGHELLAATDIPDEISSLMSAGGDSGMLQIHSVANPFIREDYNRIVTTLDDWVHSEGLGNWQLSGAPALNERINELLAKDVATVLPFGCFAILLALVIGTRSFLLPLVILAPLLLSLIWLAGLMSVAGVALSAVTIAIAPLVLGIGVDGGVHFLSSWRRHKGNLEAVFAETGLAVMVTIITSIAAFGTFVFSMSPSLVRFGSQASLALAGCLVVTFVLLPTIARHFLSPNHIKDDEED